MNAIMVTEELRNAIIAEYEAEKAAERKRDTHGRGIWKRAKSLLPTTGDIRTQYALEAAVCTCVRVAFNVRRIEHLTPEQEPSVVRFINDLREEFEKINNSLYHRAIALSEDDWYGKKIPNASA